ncbi:MAG: cell envelope integrity protein CreD [Gallionella sp.]|nr:cell envelope integrity protein CreD [Gallionella sp.]MDD4957749.1 cell envelope integrity protein CreD [Gallionella sp.]
MLRNPLFSKILMVCFLAVLLLIPLGMIQSKISERQMLQTQVQQDIARSASGPQTISGPYLVIKYRLHQRETTKDSNGVEKTTLSESDIQEAVIAPHALKIDGNAEVEIRSRGIYQARLFNLHSTLAGDFVVPVGYGINKPLADIIPVSAAFVLKVSDSRGIRNAPKLTLNGSQFDFAPGNVSAAGGNGIHVPLSVIDAATSPEFKFNFPFELQGMTTLAVTPAGNTTEMSLKSTWPHPSFGGSYLPRSRVVDDKGFTAQWLVTNLARNNTGAEDIFSIDFIDPVNIYLLSERAVKYGVLFIILVFTSFFMFEVLRSLRIHPMQYLLVGLAMAMFFLLVISLSEHMSFLIAYAVSGAACVALIGSYLAGLLKSRKPALAFSGCIALLYAVLYGVLQSEDNALLMGTLILFATLTAVMLLTRRMDWYGLSTTPTAD